MPYRPLNPKPTHRLAEWAVAAVLAFALLTPRSLLAQDRLYIVTTLPTYAAIARELTGELAIVEAIARGDEDPHFVNPRPSFAAKVQRADMFIATGLDLELWVPAVLDRARNPRVIEGGPGNVVAYSGVTLLEVPEVTSRAGGDVHVFGNPHIHTDPVNGIIIARNILRTLNQVDPANAAAYESNSRRFEDRLLRRLFGDQLVEILGPDALFQLAREYKFWDFARAQEYQGKALTEYLGGWLAEAAPFRDRQVACYHKNWAYFSARFRVRCAIYVEPQPGIPPSPGHLANVVDLMRDESIPVIFAANYFSHAQVERVASRTNAKAVIVPEHVAGAEGIDTYFDLIDTWVSNLSTAFLALDRRREHRE
jgi:ABC-type Zn uptake system ZnuABC Zn-binding protein ZnuA